MKKKKTQIGPIKEHKTHPKQIKDKAEPGLVSFYDIRPRNRSCWCQPLWSNC